MTLDHRADADLIPALERELSEGREQLTRLVDRTDALAALYEIAIRVQDEQGRPISIEDVRIACAVKGERERADLKALLRRTLGDPAWDG